MSSLLTTLYVAFSHLSPEYVFPGIAPYRPLVWLAALAILAACFTMIRNSVAVLTFHNSLLIGLFVVILFSSAVEAGRAGVISAFSYFVPSFVSFFLCTATIQRTRHVRLLIASLLMVAAYQTISGIVAYYSNEASAFVFTWPPIEQQVSGQAVLRRIRGLGFLNDPNDFAQFLLVLMPFMWTAWRKQALLRNFCLVVVPTALVLWAVVLTQSRGALLGFGAILLFLLRSRFGNTKGVALTLVLVAGIMASGAWQRGELSVHEDSAAGRVEAWGNGISMWKSSPVWGVGFGRFGYRNEDQAGLTAHNSFVLCFAELGILGYLVWLSLITATLLDLNSILETRDTDDPADDDLIRLAIAIRLSLIAYLVTAWFLSRTYVVTLYVLLGIAVAVVQIADRETEASIRATPSRAFAWSTGAAMASVVLLYCTLWIRAF